MTLTRYRKLVRDAWLSVVGRRFLKSHEYDFIKQLFNSQTPVEAVLRATQNCADRARKNGNTIYSLGVIKADLRTVMAKQADSNVGAHTQDWRRQWADDLAVLVKEEDDRDFSDLYRGLLSELPTLTEAQAHTRWQEIQARMREQGKTR